MHKKQQFIWAYWAAINQFSNPELLSKLKAYGKGAFCIDLVAEPLNFHKICELKHLIDLSEHWREANGFVHLLSMTKYLVIPFVLELLDHRYPEYYAKVLHSWGRIGFEVSYD